MQSKRKASFLEIPKNDDFKFGLFRDKRAKYSLLTFDIIIKTRSFAQKFCFYICYRKDVDRWCL